MKVDMKMNNMKVAIICAGMGSRLWNKTDKTPKTLLPYSNGTILSTIIDYFRSIGLNNFIIVVGYKKEYIIEYLNNNNNLGTNIEIIENPDWEKGNGISVQVCKDFVNNQSFILSMSDHIVSPTGLAKIIDADSSFNHLLLDKKVNDIFDIDDATKVYYENDFIRNIGKNIDIYNAIDCGVFKLNSEYFTAIETTIKNGQDSISSAINILIKNNLMKACFLSENDHWIDIDTPEAYNFARKIS